MKRILFILMMFIAFIQINAITTSGKWISLEGGMKIYPMRMSLSIKDDNNVHLNAINILIVSNKEEQIKERDTKAVLKFQDGSIIELDSYGESSSKYDPQVVYGVVYNLYQSWQSYVIDEDELNILLSQPIVKIRVEQNSGDRKDIDISNKQGKKVMKQLNESWKLVNSVHLDRMQNDSSDIKSGF